MKDVFDQLAKKYRTPKEVQLFIKTFEYNREEGGETCRSAASALKVKKAHCLEATFLAGAILERHGYEPLAVSLESKDGLDHVIYVYQNSRGHWGSIGRSRDRGLHGRPAVFKNLRQLCWSYYDPFVDKSGMLKAYQVFHLDEVGADWRFSPDNVWAIEKFMIDEKHIPLPSSKARYTKLYENYRLNGPLISGPHWW